MLPKLRITAIKPYPVWVGIRNQFLLKIETDQGVYGIGDATINGREKAAVAYLERTFDESTGTWPIVPPDTESYPHAPWWSQDGLSDRFNHFKLNPMAEIVAHLHALGVEPGPGADAILRVHAWLAVRARRRVVPLGVQ